MLCLPNWKNTRAALAGVQSEIKLPEGRDFYWSKIKREIQRLDTPATAAAPVSISQRGVASDSYNRESLRLSLAC